MAAPAPPGTPEYEAWAAQDKGPSIIITCWTVTSISTAFVLARLLVRGGIQKRLQMDDWFIIMSCICGYISTALSTVAVHSGNGQHWETLTTEQQEGVMLWTTAAFCPGILSFGLPKLAVVVLLTRLLNPDRGHYWFLWGLGIVCNLTLVATIGTLLGQCIPAESLWDFSITDKTCYPKNIVVDYSLYAAAMSAFTDLYLAFYPTFVLFKLQLPTRKKIALSVALGIGSVSAVIAIYKSTRIPSLASDDFSYNTADLVIWTIVEGSAIMIGTSIPLLQPLWEMITGRSFTGSKRSKEARYYENYSHQSATQNSRAGGRRHRKGGPSADFDLEMTLQNSGSEEKILGPDGNLHVTPKKSFGSAGDSPKQGAFTGSPSQASAAAHYQTRPSTASNVPGLAIGDAIMRTDEVTVTIDDNNGQTAMTAPETNTRGWR